MFRGLILAGDFTPKVNLQGVMAKHPTTGVGAVADARGEITIYDGKLVVSYGKDAARQVPEAETAALLAVGTVAGWQTLTVERDVAPEEVETFLAHAAIAHGLKPDVSFPFHIRGTLAPCRRSQSRSLLFPDRKYDSKRPPRCRSRRYPW
jgi:hypothetical protein